MQVFSYTICPFSGQEMKKTLEHRLEEVLNKFEQSQALLESKNNVSGSFWFYNSYPTNIQITIFCFNLYKTCLESNKIWRNCGYSVNNLMLCKKHIL